MCENHYNSLLDTEQPELDPDDLGDRCHRLIHSAKVSLGLVVGGQ
jgi:hypothetical protein